MKGCALAVAVLAAGDASAHDFWSNGEAVPPWVKSWCCSKSDVHRLEPSAVHIQADGYHIDGLANPIPVTRALPSADGFYWAFFREEDGPNAWITCFYAPLNGS